MTEKLTVERIAEIRDHAVKTGEFFESTGWLSFAEITTLCDLAILGLKVEAAPVGTLEDVNGCCIYVHADWPEGFAEANDGKRVRIVTDD